MLKYHIITFGCQMNKSDSERVATLLEQINCSAVDDLEKADIIVINACSVRQSGIDRIWGYFRKFDKIKKKKDLKTVLTGCLLEADKKKFSLKFDFVFDIKELTKLEKYLHEQIIYSDENYFNILPKTSIKSQAFVPIMTGCNNFCSYCAVPYVRGREVSRSVKEVLAEVKHLVDNGAKEIHLLGQNVNSYKPKDLKSFSQKNPFKHKFARLLWEINSIKGIERINFVASHPKDMADEVITALALPKQMNYLHLALQSGDDQILKKMNRQYTAKDYEKIIHKIRKIKPEIALGTDIIVGFPGETKEQFNNTLKLYKRIRFDIAYLAMYSPRAQTKAQEYEDDVPYLEKKRRWHAVQNLMKKVTLEKNQKYVGQEVEVLIDKVTDKYAEGNSREMKRVRVLTNQLKLGTIVNLEIKKAQTWMLLA